jgi:hypothetical protein
MTASVAGCITRIVVIVRELCVGGATNGALVPMLCRVLIPISLVRMGYSTFIGTGVTGRIAGIIVNVIAFVSYLMTTDTLKPMFVCVIIPSCLIGVGMRILIMQNSEQFGIRIIRIAIHCPYLVKIESYKS